MSTITGVEWRCAERTEQGNLCGGEVLLNDEMIRKCSECGAEMGEYRVALFGEYPQGEAWDGADYVSR